MAERRLPDIERSGETQRRERGGRTDGAGESFVKLGADTSGSTMRLTPSESFSWTALLVLLAVRWSDCSK